MLQTAAEEGLEYMRSRVGGNGGAIVLDRNGDIGISWNRLADVKHINGEIPSLKIRMYENSAVRFNERFPFSPSFPLLLRQGMRRHWIFVMILAQGNLLYIRLRSDTSLRRGFPLCLWAMLFTKLKKKLL